MALPWVHSTHFQPDCTVTWNTSLLRTSCCLPWISVYLTLELHADAPQTLKQKIPWCMYAFSGRWVLLLPPPAHAHAQFHSIHQGGHFYHLCRVPGRSDLLLFQQCHLMQVRVEFKRGMIEVCRKNLALVCPAMELPLCTVLF